MATITANSGGGNWSSTATWSTAAVPTAADDVILASTSGAVTVDNASALCRSLSCTTTGNYTGTLTFAASSKLTMGTSTSGNLTLYSGMTLTVGSNSSIVFASTTTGNTITTAGKQMPTVTFSGAAGGWTLQDNFSNAAADGDINHNAGTLNTNGVTITTWVVSSTGSTARTLTLGSSTINMAVSGSVWTLSGSNLTFTANTATLNLSGPSPTFAGGGFTYGGTVNFSSIGNGPTITGNNTFANLTFTGSASSRAVIAISGSQTVTGTLTMNGNSLINRLLVCNTTYGTSSTITCNGTIVASYLNISDITGAGTASWNLSAITGGAGDGGGNSGITFTTAQNCYMKTAVSANWSGSIWFTTSGGSTSTRVPLLQDTAILDANSVTAASITITLDYSGLPSINCTGVLNSPTLSFASGNYFIYGSMTMTTTVITNSNSPMFVGRGTPSINGVTLTPGAVIGIGNYTITGTNTFNGNGFSCVGGTLTLGSSTVNAASINFSNFGGYFPATPNNSIINYGSSTINLTGTTSTFSGPSATTGTNTSSINFTDTTSGAKSFYSSTGGTTFYNLSVAGASGAGALTIGSTANTFNKVTLNAGSSVVFPASTTTTVSRLYCLGTAAAGITITSSSSGTQATISQAAHNVNGDYISIKDSKVQGGATFLAGTHSTNVSNNTGWSFTANQIRTIASGGGNWSSTSTWVEGSVPTASNDVIATSSSGNLTVDGTSGSPSLCNSMELTNYVGTLTMGSTAYLTMGSSIAGDLLLVSGMTYSPNTAATINLVGTSTANLITTAGKNIPNINFTSGKYTFQDTFTCTGSSGMTESGTGSLTTNNQAVNTAYFTFSTATGTLTLGTSSVTITGGANCWYVSAAGTISAASSTITFTNTTPEAYLYGTYGTIIFTQVEGYMSGGQSYNFSAALQSNTIANLSITSGSSGGYFCIGGGTITVTGTLTLAGYSATARLTLCTDWIGFGVAGISAATVVASNVNFQDIAASGSANWNLSAITGGAGDAGGNTGITFTTAQSCYLVTAVSCNFSSSSWYTTTGGSTPTRVPLPQDTAVIDANSVTATGKTITFDMVSLPGITASAVTNSPTFTFSNSFLAPTLVNGSFLLNSGVTVNASQGIYLVGGSSGSYTLNTSTANVSSVSFYTAGRSSSTTYTLGHNITCSNLYPGGGIFSTGGYNVTCGTMNGADVTWSQSAGTNITNSTITLNGTAQVWYHYDTVTTTNSTILITDTTSSAKLFYDDNGNTYNNLTISGATSSGAVSITGGNITFNVLTFQPSSSIVIQNSTTITVTSLVCAGTSGNVITLTSDLSGTAATISQASGTVSGDYMSIKDCHATGGANFYAGPLSHSTNVSNTTGWIFLAPPTFSITASNTQANSTSISLTTLYANDLILLFVSTQTNPTTAVSSSPSLTWVNKVASFRSGSGANQVDSSLWYAFAPTAQAYTISITDGSDATGRLDVCSVSLADTTHPFDSGVTLPVALATNSGTSFTFNLNTDASSAILISNLRTDDNVGGGVGIVSYTPVVFTDILSGGTFTDFASYTVSGSALSTTSETIAWTGGTSDATLIIVGVRPTGSTFYNRYVFSPVYGVYSNNMQNTDLFIDPVITNTYVQYPISNGFQDLSTLQRKITQKSVLQTLPTYYSAEDWPDSLELEDGSGFYVIEP